jgi:hypothetical protein
MFSKEETATTTEETTKETATTTEETTKETATTTEDTTKERLLRELQEIAEIRDASRKCARDCVSEAAWNDEVHSRFLRLALKPLKGVEHQNMCVDYVPRDRQWLIRPAPPLGL